MNQQQQDGSWNPYAATAEQGGTWMEPQKTSLLAIFSLVCGLVFFCPVIMQVLGFLLGIGGILSIKMSGGKRKGMGFAIAGILLSVVIASLWIAGGIAGMNYYKGFAAPAKSFVMAIQDGDITEITSQMSTSTAAMVTPDQIISLQTDLNDNCGKLIDLQLDFMVFGEIANLINGQNPSQIGQMEYGSSQPLIPLPFAAEFENESRSGIAFIEIDPQNGQTSILAILISDGTAVTFFPDPDITMVPVPGLPSGEVPAVEEPELPEVDPDAGG